MTKSVLIVGGGIMGLATARAFGAQGYKTTVLERSPRARGSSIRNFGMVWPIGQPEGLPLEWALKSRSIWLELAKAGGIWHEASGSVMALRNVLELSLALEFTERETSRNLRMLSTDDALKKAPFLKKDGLLAAMYSDTEVIVEAREVIRILPDVLATTYGTNFIFNTAVREVRQGTLITARGEVLNADLIVVCNGYDFATLYPQFFDMAPISMSVLQMMRSAPLSLKTVPISAGLTFLHYPSFEKLKDLNKYKDHCAIRYPKLLQMGIHLLVSQNEQLSLTIGDSHVYGRDCEPFREEAVDHAMLEYFHEVMDLPRLSITQRWNGTYAKLTNGTNHLLTEMEPGVWVFNGPGGAGMTLSFGMADYFFSRF